MMPKLPVEFCIDSFIYEEYTGLNKWGEREYADPITINNCRIDRGAQYSQSSSGKQLLFNSLVLCYQGITNPIPKFKNESILTFDGIDHVATKVIPIYEAYKNTLYSYEIEVI